MGSAGVPMCRVCAMCVCFGALPAEPGEHSALAMGSSTSNTVSRNCSGSQGTGAWLLSASYIWVRCYSSIKIEFLTSSLGKHFIPHH